MPLPAKDEESRYLMLGCRRGEDVDDDEFEEDASDVSKSDSLATLCEKAAATTSSSRHRHRSYSLSSFPFTSTLSRKRRQRLSVISWLRWGVIVGFQSIIILLLLRHDSESGESDQVFRGKVVETGGDINGLYKTLSHTYTFLKPEAETFIPNMTTNANRMEVRRNWDLLMPLGSGSVAIPDYRDHPLLGDPITDDPIRSGPIFEASWTHALHCLYYSVDSYHQLIVNGRSDKDNPVHATHCFEYLRNSILCNLDMTLEGSMSTPADKDRGQPHVCRDRQEAIKWIEARRLDDLQDIVGP